MNNEQLQEAALKVVKESSIGLDANEVDYAVEMFIAGYSLKDNVADGLLFGKFLAEHGWKPYDENVWENSEDDTASTETLYSDFKALNPYSLNKEAKAKAYADGFYPIKDYDHYESDYDYRTQCAKNRQVQEHFISGAKAEAERAKVLVDALEKIKNGSGQWETIDKYIDLRDIAKQALDQYSK